MATLSTETANKVNTSTQDIKGKIQGAENYLERASHNLGQKTGEMATSLAETASEYVQTSREYVKENPLKSVGIAAAAGMVAGGLLTLALSKRH